MARSSTPGVAPDRVPRRVLIATTNPAKEERLRSLLAGQGVVFRRLAELGDAPPPEETAGSHLEIARVKAVYWSERVEGLALASDGGMDIPALGPQWDSLTTHRAAGDVESDDERVRHLLDLMAPYEGEDRTATWREAVALADDGEVIGEWEVEGPTGYLLREPVQARIPGFWVACLWRFPEIGKAYTELTVDELRRIGDPWMRLWELVQNDLNMGRVVV